LEGERLCKEILGSDVQVLQAITGPHFEAFDIPAEIPRVRATQQQINQISENKSPQGIICVGQIPLEKAIPEPSEKDLILALDRVSDPGNLGTILRSAHWFGAKHILLSPDCADPFSPKVVRSSMGAIGGVYLHRNTDLQAVLGKWVDQDGDVVILHMEGQSLDAYEVRKPLIMVVGSEAHGVHPNLLKYGRQLVIPGAGGGESLNAAMAASIALWEMCSS